MFICLRMKCLPILPVFILSMLMFNTGLSFHLFSQSPGISTRHAREARIDSVFDTAERDGMKTSSTLRYEYFFRDKRKEFLENFADRLNRDSFETIGIYQKDDEWQLRVVKNEIHSRTSMEKQERKFRWLKFKYLIDHYDGFAIWPADLDPTIVPNDEFVTYIDQLSDEELFWVGNRLSQLKQYPKTLLVWNKAIERDIHPDTSYYMMGNALIATHEYVEGIKLMEKAVEINPSYIEVHMQLGKIFFENSHWKKALSHYQKADAIDPDNPLILYHMAETLYQLKRYSEAYSYIKRSTRLDPHNEFACSLQKMLNRPAIRKARKAEAQP